MSMAVATVVPNNEKKVIKHFDKVGVNHYAPKVMTRYAKHGVIHERKTFLFPGYIFVGDHSGFNWRHVLQTPGVNGILLSGEKPAVVSMQIIDELKSNEQDGHIIVDVIPKRRRFRKGQLVRANSGPFASFDGLVANILGQDTIRILFNIFGRKTPVLMNSTNLSVV